LLLTGYRLANPALFRDMYRKGFHQLAPFLVTLGAILVSDLLKGMAIGMACGLYFIIRINFEAAITLTRDGANYLVRLHQNVSFLNKVLLRESLSRIEENSSVLIDGSRTLFIEHDILETIHDFVAAARDDNITVELKNMPEASRK
jgi:MFS superfamily sulfate permease-like transporter